MYSNGENNALPVKKNNGTKVLVVFLLLLLVGIVGYGGWQLSLLDKSDKDRNKEVSKEEDSIKEANDPSLDENTSEAKDETPKKNEDYTFELEEKQKLDVNGKNFELITYYYVDKQVINDYFDKEESHEKYFLRREVFVNNNVVEDIAIINCFDSLEEALESAKKDDSVISNFMNDVTTKDKVVVIQSTTNDGIIKDDLFFNMDTAVTNLFVLSDEGKVLKSIPVGTESCGIAGIFATDEMINDRTAVDYTFNEEDTELGIDNTYKHLLYSGNWFDLHSNYLFYIVLSDDGSTIDEYKLTVEDGKIKEEKTATYDKFSLVGGC